MNKFSLKCKKKCLNLTCQLFHRFMSLFICDPGFSHFMVICLGFVKVSLFFFVDVSFFVCLLHFLILCHVAFFNISFCVCVVCVFVLSVLFLFCAVVV